MRSPLLPAVLFACLSFVQCNCNKDADKPKADNPYGLPNATQTGKGVFACRINGINAIAKNDINHIGAWMSPQEDTLNVFGSFGERFFQVLSLGSIQKNRKTGVPYSLQDTSLTTFLYGTDSTCSGISSSFPDIHTVTGIITYSKIDTLKMIVSGTFSCKIPIPDCDTLLLTNGRFDIRYHF